MRSSVKPRRSPAKRRGATLVMVAFTIIPLMGVLAIAADIGRFYVVTGELQTAADAAAIAGARKLQLTPGTTPETAVDAAVVAFVPQATHADGAVLSVTAAKVRMGFWNPVDKTMDYNLGIRRPNAVNVEIAAAPRGIFSQIIGKVTGLPLSRSGTAWIANLGANCVRPWAFPYLPLYKAVSGNPAATDIAPDLDPGQFVTYAQKDSSQHFFTILGANQTSTQANDGNWLGFNFTGNAGKPGFTDGIQTCRDYAVGTDASNGVTLPGQADQYVNWSTQAIVVSGSNPGICYMKNKDAGCYASSAAMTAGKPGVTINAVWGNVVGVGSNTIDFRYVGEFVLKCFYTSPTDVCSAPQPGTPSTGYPEGTLVGFMQTLKSRIITPDDIAGIGNTPSNVQRIILVQ